MNTHVDTIPELDAVGLRKFGLLTGGIIAGLFGALIPWLIAARYPLWPWIIFAVLALLALTFPKALKPVYIVWMKFGLIMSKITTPLILAIVFFVALLPTSLLMRLFRNDPLARRFDADARSYRIVRDDLPKDQIERPF